MAEHAGLEGAADSQGMAQARERPTPTQGGIGAQTYFSRRQGPRPARRWGGSYSLRPLQPGLSPPSAQGPPGSGVCTMAAAAGGVGTVSEPTVRELRLVVTADDYDARSLCFYRDANPAVGTDRPLPPALRQPSPSRQDRRRSALAEAGWPQEWRRAGLVGNLRPWLPSRGRTNRAIGSPGRRTPGPADKPGS